jgi:type VI secretion system protein ImpH
MMVRDSDPNDSPVPRPADAGPSPTPATSRSQSMRPADAAKGPRPAHPTGLERRLFEEGFCFDFFQAVRILQHLDRRRIPVGFAGPPRAEVVRFRAHCSLSFPPSSIHDVLRETPERTFPVMIQAFMGLTGPSGVLPRHYTDLLFRLERETTERNPEKHAFRDWFDLFNHRLVSLFYRAWEKYRVFLPYERGESHRPDPDLFTGSLFSLVGLGVPPLRNRLRVAIREAVDEGESRERVLRRIENLALLRYSGLLAQQTRSAVGLEAILQDFFQLPVKVHQFQGQWLRLEPSNQSRLGELDGNNELGLSTVVGERVWDIQSKFRIRLGAMGYDQFLDFLPDRTAVPERKALYLLVHLVRLYVGAALDFDVQLVLAGADVPECQFADGLGFGARLGWNTWLRTGDFDRDPDDAVFEGTEVIWIDAGS